MKTLDPRVTLAQSLLTGARLLEGHGQGLVRLDAVGRLVGCSIWQRPELVAWIEAQQLWHEPPFAGPLADRPLSGTIDLGRLRTALLQALASPAGLPFKHTLEPQP
jgi:hypothetical protein